MKYDGNHIRWWDRSLTIDLDMTLDEFMDEYPPNNGVGTIVFELEDGRVSIAATYEGHMHYRGDPWNDIERKDVSE